MRDSQWNKKYPTQKLEIIGIRTFFFFVRRFDVWLPDISLKKKQKKTRLHFLIKLINGCVFSEIIASQAFKIFDKKRNYSVHIFSTCSLMNQFPNRIGYFIILESFVEIFGGGGRLSHRPHLFDLLCIYFEGEGSSPNFLTVLWKETLKSENVRYHQVWTYGKYVSDLIKDNTIKSKTQIKFLTVLAYKHVFSFRLDRKQIYTKKKQILVNF